MMRQYYYRLWLVVLVSLLLFMPSAEAQEQVNTAEQAYLEGNYEQAIRLYQLLLAEDNDSGAIQYNLGNAYYQIGQLGDALVYYRRAEQTLPRHADLERQIMRVQAIREDGNMRERDWLVILHDTTAEFVSIAELGWFAFLSWSGFFCLFSFGSRKRRWLYPLVMVSLLTLIIVGLFGVRLYVNDQRPLAVVTADEIISRSGPGEQYLSLYSLYEATEVRILERRDHWVRVVLPDQRQGWVSVTDIERIHQADAD